MAKGIQTIRERRTSAELASALDHFGRRWALRVVWELRSEARNFRALRQACGEVSPGVMQARLHELRRLGLVEAIPGLGYRLTAAGDQLFKAIAPIADWAENHLRGPDL
ncbi:MAG: winged helix-turn-helix transcriptional regulator [Woeseia sp.]